MLLPPSVREALGGLAPGAWLSIDSAETWVPWELLRVSRGPDQSLPGRAFAVTRSGIENHVARFATMPCVLVTPPGGEALVRREQQALASLDVRLRQVNRLMDALPLLSQPGMAVWHITGTVGLTALIARAPAFAWKKGAITGAGDARRAIPQSRPDAAVSGRLCLPAVSEPATPQAPLAPPEPHSGSSASWRGRRCRRGHDLPGLLPSARSLPRPSIAPGAATVRYR